MQTNSVNPISAAITVLLLSATVVCAQEVGTSNTSPCVNPAIGIGYYFIPVDQCQPTGMSIRNATVNVDYQVVNSSTGSMTLNWLKPTTTAVVEISYSGCQGGGSGVASLPVVVRAATPSLPGTSFTTTASSYQEITLSVPGYSRPLRWYDHNHLFIRTSSQLKIGYKKPGTYVYNVTITTEAGECGPVSTTSATVTLQVTEGTDDNLNWMETVAFNEQAQIIANSRSYYDIDGRPLQDQVKNLSKNEVMAAQIVPDQLLRPALQTLPAPINRTDFKYHATFISANDGLPYTPSKFDEPVGSATPGTLGWYYSSNNTKEDHVPVTGYPYSRTQFYDADGTGESRRVTSPGEVHRLGEGHELLSAVFPIGNELTDYFRRRGHGALQFLNPSFENGTMGPWENFNPHGSTSNQNFQWIYEGSIVADGTSSGYAQTGLIGQKRGDGGKWRAGQYTVRINASNFSTGGMEPFTSGLSVYASDNPTSGAQSMSYTGNGSLNVGTSAELVVTFNLDTDYNYIMFNFTKYGPSSGYRVKIYVSEIIMLVAAGTPVTETPVEPADKGIQTVVRDENGMYNISFQDKAGHTVMTATKGTSDDYTLAVTNYITIPRENTNSWYFYLLNDQVPGGLPLSAYTIENVSTGLPYSPQADGDPEWEAGFYRIIYDGFPAQLNYTNYYKDVTYNFYNDIGAPLSSVSPNGMQKLKQGVSYELIDKTSYEYNYKGWLLSLTEPDAGKIEYQYRRDGRIRFSQNAQQRANAQTAQTGTGKFSYTLYDELGRPKESGEYIGIAESFGGSVSQLEFTKQKQYPSADTKDWVRTYYDEPASSIPNLPSTFKQQFVRRLVSWTENVNIRTWYSYDEMGRVKWMAQKPTFLNKVFLSQYTYDFSGKLISVSNSICETGGALTNAFYHFYEYDADQRLLRAYTSRDGSNKQLRASYEYYLHGPLKRVELGDRIQGIDFVYNINGWLRQINHPNKTQDPGGDDNDVFGLLLDYYESSINNLFQSSATPQGLLDPRYFHRLPELENYTLREGLAASGNPKNLNEIMQALRKLKSEYKNESAAMD